MVTAARDDARRTPIPITPAVIASEQQIADAFTRRRA